MFLCAALLATLEMRAVDQTRSPGARSVLRVQDSRDGSCLVACPPWVCAGLQTPQYFCCGILPLLLTAFDALKAQLFMSMLVM